MTGRQRITIGICLISILTLTGFFNQGQAEHRENYLVRGSWSMQFGIVQDFTLKAFNGGLISVKRHLSPSTALRMGLTFNGDVGDQSSENLDEYQQFGVQNLVIRTTDGNTSGISLSLSTQLMVYSSIEKSINLYFGIGPNFNYSLDKEEFDVEYIYEDLPERDGYQDRLLRSWSIGFLGSWGVEWFATRKISFIAEYGARAEYNSVYRERSSLEFVDEISRRDSFTEDRHDFRFITDAVKFGISLYFN
ncbi:MAG TPA: hypothetical protein ENO22_10270 [candidate division Zixibacteria bacterium]|nr:hypothetical protein [candidate division Zixibacteria bacterium]HEQ99711.1 hypothetical protein [candidate division Zixibacteria bacterium]